MTIFWKDITIITDVLVLLIHQDGYSTGEIEYLTGGGGSVYSIDASKDGQDQCKM